MAIVYLNDGSATGTAPVGTGAVVVVERAHTPDYPSPTWAVMSAVDLAALQALEPSQSLWKVAGGTLVEMTGVEKEAIAADKLTAAKAALKDEIASLVDLMKAIAQAAASTEAQVDAQQTEAHLRIDAVQSLAALKALGLAEPPGNRMWGELKKLQLRRA